MPDSNLIRIETQLKNQYEKAASALERFKTIAGALPKDCPEFSEYGSSGYCAEACLTFVDAPGRLEALQRVLPAEPLIWLKEDPYNFTVKPRFALRDNELKSDYLPVMPIIQWDMSHLGLPTGTLVARWWCRLGRYPVEVILKGVSPESFQPFLRNCYQVGIHHNEAYLPKPDASPTVRSALAQWRANGGREAEFDQARHIELEQVDKIREALTEIFAKGYISEKDGYLHLYILFIENVLRQRTGVYVELTIFSGSLGNFKTVSCRVYLDEKNRNTSFYDLSIPQRLDCRLRLKDIPVYYNQS